MVESQEWRKSNVDVQFCNNFERGVNFVKDAHQLIIYK